jgi:hypothetical protein
LKFLNEWPNWLCFWSQLYYRPSTYNTLNFSIDHQPWTMDYNIYLCAHEPARRFV